MESIKIEILYTPEDLQKSYQIHFNKMYPIRSKMVLILGILLVVLGILLALLEHTGSRSLLLGTSYIFLGFIAVGFYFWNRATIGKRMFKKLPDFSYPYIYTIGDEGLLVTSKNITTEVKWAHFWKAVICTDMILIYPNKFRYNLFPKKYFTPEQFEQLTKLVVDNVHTNKK